MDKTCINKTCKYLNNKYINTKSITFSKQIYGFIDDTK